MTVTPFYFYALLWAFLLCAAGCAFFSSRLADRRDQLDTLIRISASNTDNHFRVEANWCTEVLNKAQLTDPLPNLNGTKWRALQDLYATDEMQGYTIPAQITTNDNDRPSVFWKVTKLNQLEAYELARLWLWGVL